MGNAWEWSASAYDAETRELRGAEFSFGNDDLRAADRGTVEPAYRYYFIGFRCDRK